MRCYGLRRCDLAVLPGVRDERPAELAAVRLVNGDCVRELQHGCAVVSTHLASPELVRGSPLRREPDLQLPQRHPAATESAWGR